MRTSGSDQRARGAPQRRSAAPPEALRAAFAAYSGGNPAEAERLCRAVAASRPDLFDAWHLLGVIQAQLGKGDKALTSYARALALRPDSAEALTNRGAALHDLGRFAEALASYDAALRMRPDFAHALTNRAMALHALGRFEEALAGCDAALAAAPDHPEALARRAAALHALGRFEEALAGYDRALARRPGDPEALYNRGNALGRLGRMDEALSSYERALGARPDYPEALANRGAALYVQKRFAEALASFDRALVARPNDVEALYNSGAALHELKRYEDAVERFDRTLALRPDHADARYNRGATFVALKRYSEALADFERISASRPDHPHAFAAAANCALQLCDWDRRAGFSAAMAAQVAQGRAIIAPFTLLGYAGEPALQLRCARNYVAQMIPSPPLPLWTGGSRRGGRLRVAYLSADFRRHAIGYLVAELIELHDRAQFEIVGVSFGPDDGSPIRGRLAAAFDSFHDVRGASDLEAARLVRGLEVDIAVDLMGFTQDARFGILAHRPAPIQVNYLGFPATMGADFIDYVLADATVAPPGCEAWFAEKVVRLPDCYQVNDGRRAIAAESPTRAQAGLPESGFVFCCFNNAWKITPEVFDVWMRLLGRVDGAVLWLLAGDERAQDNLRAQARARNVDPSRLVFAGPLPLEAHLARQRLADLFLDTLPYNAHTTASDALWAGLPVVTRLGDGFAGRVAASLLRAVGMADLATSGLEEYEALALRLAQAPDQLAAVRARLARNRLTHPLFDADRFRRHVETAYRKMSDSFGRGEAPRGFDVAAEPPGDRPHAQ
ncbi:MAG: tetratricopeptide repeat protein [Roseiarcus sp.]|jgi:predicted O-linked N-acetylglucosamine transferase (SPINDLY family)